MDNVSGWLSSDKLPQILKNFNKHNNPIQLDPYISFYKMKFVKKREALNFGNNNVIYVTEGGELSKP